MSDIAKIGIFSILVFAGIFIANISLVANFYPILFGEGRFQDVFAGITAFFSGLAFLGVIFAITLQREELKLQREELKLTRGELKRTAEAQEKSEQALTKQAASLKRTAKLNGLSAKLQHYNTLIELSHTEKFGLNGPDYAWKKQRADEIIAQIDAIIDDK
jgi:hypothetical protein